MNKGISKSNVSNGKKKKRQHYEVLRISVPIELIPDWLKNKSELRLITEKLLTYIFNSESIFFKKINEEIWIPKIGKGYIPLDNGFKRLDNQFDVSLSGHVLGAIWLYLLFLNLIEPIHIDKNELEELSNCVKNGLIALFLHDLNKAIGKEYRKMSKKEVKELIEKILNELNIDGDIESVIRFIECAEKRTIGALLGLIPTKCDAYKPLICFAIETADAVMGVSSEYPPNEMKILNKIKESINKIFHNIGMSAAFLFYGNI